MNERMDGFVLFPESRRRGVAFDSLSGCGLIFIRRGRPGEMFAFLVANDPRRRAGMIFYEQAPIIRIEVVGHAWAIELFSASMTPGERRNRCC